jgi:hypothetical protein
VSSTTLAAKPLPCQLLLFQVQLQFPPELPQLFALSDHLAHARFGCPTGGGMEGSVDWRRWGRLGLLDRPVEGQKQKGNGCPEGD